MAPIQPIASEHPISSGTQLCMHAHVQGLVQLPELHHSKHITFNMMEGVRHAAWSRNACFLALLASCMIYSAYSLKSSHARVHKSLMQLHGWMGLVDGINYCKRAAPLVT